MTLLKPETLFSVIDAAVEAGLECDSLLLSIPREAQSLLVRASGRAPRDQYWSILNQLNDWGASDRKEPPLRTLMQAMQFLAGARGQQAHVFQRALEEIGNAPSTANEQGEVLFLRAKDCYVARSYRVVPPLEAPTSLTFQAWRGVGSVSVVGVAAVAPLHIVIEAVKNRVAQLGSFERVEGVVVLFTHEPVETQQVREAGLVPVQYSELAPMGVREITAFVDRQQSELVQGPTGADGISEDADVCRALRAVLREAPVRVVTITTPRVAETARSIVLSLTSDFLRDPARAAPLLLPLSPRSTELQQLVATAFGELKVPFSRFDFPGLLAEKAFLPVFTVDSRESMASEASPARAVLEQGGKVVLVTSHERAVTPQEVARFSGARVHSVRTLVARKASNPGPIDASGGVKGIRRFEQGRALLVGVAKYTHVPPLPESVLHDARDLAAVLHSPDRCGYLEANVELLLDEQATADKLRRGLKRLAKEANREDTVVVYFSGHGLREAGHDSEAYLLPIDYDPEDLARTALSATELTTLLASIRSSRLVVLLDACHAAGAAFMKSGSPAPTFKSGLDEKTYEVLGRGVGRVVIASSRANELSCGLPGMRNSLFTTYLLEALVGAGTHHEAEVVRVLEVFNHVSHNVPLKAAQHPILKTQNLENNFPIALNPRTKRVAPPPSPPVTPAREVERRPSRNGHVAPLPLAPKARLAIKRGLVSRWDDLADYFGIPLTDKSKFARGYEGQRTLDWLEERGRLHQLEEAFAHFGWDDLLAELDRHSP